MYVDTPASPMQRCPWPGQDPDYIHYHDHEWGRPLTDDRALFAKLVLEGFQAGLSWLTILKKRARFATAFDQFDPEKIARYTEADIDRLMNDPGIVRNRRKIEATIHNANMFLALTAEQSFARFVWQTTGCKMIVNQYSHVSELPAQTGLSRTLSNRLKAAGFKFCGPVTLYAFMQSVGMVNDHLVHCPQHAPCTELGRRLTAFA